MNTNEMTEQPTDRAKEIAEDVAEQARGFTETAKQKAYEAGAAADYYVREYAWITMGLVALTAGLIGYAIGRRQS